MPAMYMTPEYYEAMSGHGADWGMIPTPPADDHDERLAAWENEGGRVLG